MTSHKVDVVIADAEPETPALSARQETHEPERVDVTPDPNRRIIYLAATKRAGYDEVHALGIEPVAVVTPRSPESAYGITADAIEVSAALTTEEVDALMPHVLPSLATTREA